jgi:pyruvate dehydrogenase E1 component alpha subunit
VVLDSVKFAEESKFPDPSEIYIDVYAQADYPFIKD